ncbi:MAG: 4-(cytidine 5'-diphospho)-2-C-methyl-D-erythritol kinase [Lachnospiraceae bacterium]|nr:4-(cytidine 5'-diphospho)-2-C-methyl-D-erythritol kinase [Lachnospiraceae bacterium]
MNTIKVKAPAKINLTLDVIRRRSDGYHDLKMIMQTIDIYDELTITETGASNIELVMAKELPEKLAPEDNLVYKAAKLMQETYSLPGGFSIHLEKNIPAAAGLAGGSSDCAATLLGINELFELHLSKETLCELGVTLGADVPFCIHKGTMLAEGIGEILTPLPNLAPLWVVLLKPLISVSTAEVFGNLNLRYLFSHPDTKLAIDAIAHRDYVSLGQNLENVLEFVTIEKYPLLADLKEFLLQSGALGALMSGSGPTVYGLFRDETLARIALKTAESKYDSCEYFLCKTQIPENES